MKSTPITQIMTKNVVCVSPDQKLIDVKHIYEKKKFHHHIPVVRNEKLVGMVSLVDFMYRIKGAGLDDQNAVYNDLSVKDIMTSNPHFRNTDATVEDVAEELAQGDYRAIPILENNRVVGIVSTADVIRFFLKNPPKN
ncbi:MAG: CBS domain-containing protein [Flavobacteriaceae bacterium]|nr:CBS domain-containing protein [Bacteroidia bacterium]MBT8288990.1 CBS domain-containing protein [Bacteroidia bacterium]NNF76225.1 CBS domain-containing protein [Flavobacteriaceae bacterium]NNK72949.1 CBS domain-containing protein [Flavobacteriaceae bacterium]